MEHLEKIVSELNKNSGDFKADYHNISIPIYWSYDDVDNIYYDIDSIQKEFDRLRLLLEKHNSETELIFDHI